jgi:hypothetical protein
MGALRSSAARPASESPGGRKPRAAMRYEDLNARAAKAQVTCIRLSRVVALNRFAIARCCRRTRLKRGRSNQFMGHR